MSLVARQEDRALEIRSTDALIVVDVQNDFCEGGALAVPDASKILDPVNALIGRAFGRGTVVLTQDWHPAGHSSFASTHPGKAPFDSIELAYGAQTLWPDHCVMGSAGARFHPGLHADRANLIIRKGSNVAVDSYSGFYENDRTTPTGLAGYLRDRGVTRIFIGGLATDYCVRFTALDAVREGLSALVIPEACRAIGDGAATRDEFAQRGITELSLSALI